ncbi:MAG: toll/interleukin-1 receptor domain-containing protein [Acidimicrobiales bacterium]
MSNTSYEAPGGPGVFISYRRGETSGQARAIHDMLEQRLGEQRVFMDVDAIALGEVFYTKIAEGIQSSGVALVLIGHDFFDEQNQARLHQADDWVRVEIETALHRQVPIIPILVERASMPRADLLPESLRPLTTFQAMDLENQRWDYDMQRLNNSIDTLIAKRAMAPTVPVVGAGGHAPAPPPAPPRRQPTAQPAGDDKPPRSKKPIVIGSAVLAVVIVAAVLGVVLSHKNPPSKPGVNNGPTSVSAASAVSPIAPDRMAYQLLNSSFAKNELPSSVSASKPGLSPVHAQGMVSPVVVSMTDPSFADIYVEYFIFASQADATNYYTTYDASPSGFTPKGNFSITGVGDPIKCQRSFESSRNEYASSCAVLSTSVVTFIQVRDLENHSSTDQQVTQTISVAAIKHLLKVASASPQSAMPDPPGNLDPSALFAELNSGQPGIIPFELTSESATESEFSADSPPTGLENSEYITVTIPGDFDNDTDDYIDFYVFDNSSDASKWYNGSGLIPSGSTHEGTFDSTGFVQKANCGTFTKAASGSTAATGYASCSVLDGNVIVDGETLVSSATAFGNEQIAEVLTQAGVFDIDQVDGA